MTGDAAINRPQPDTPATRAVAAAGIQHAVVDFGPVASIEEAAAAQGLGVGQMNKTLVVRVAEGEYILVVVSGDRRFSWPALRAHLGTSRLSMPDAEEAFAATGYRRGTITPFGSQGPWPVIVDRAVLRHDRVAIGGGQHGVSIQLAPKDLVAATSADVAEVTEGT